MADNATASTPDTARAVFIAWERLRVVYNAILAVLVLAVVRADWGDPEFPWELARAAFLANLCFCAGPVAEGYLAVGLGANRQVARWLMFIPGLLLACGLTVAWLSVWRLWAAT